MNTLIVDKMKAKARSTSSQVITRWLTYSEEHSTKILGALFVLSVTIFLVAIPLPRVDGMLIGSDGIGYYMYVRSMVIDHDIDFADEYKHLYLTYSTSDWAKELRTPTGLTANQFAIGPGILWLPFFVAGHLISLGLQAIGLAVTTDGYSYIYQGAVCIGSIFYGFCGMLLMHRTTKRLFADAALAACILIWLATNFVYYLVVESSMSHMCSLFATSLLVYVWMATRPVASLKQCFAVGAVGGLVGLVRQPDAALLLLPLLDDMFMHKPFLQRGKRIAVTVVGFFLVFWVQMFVWNVLNGSPFLSGYFLQGTQGFSWLSPHLLQVLFSTRHGLFLWHPVLLFAFIGLALFFRTDRLLGGLLLGGFFSQAYLIASWSSWSQADSFGGRMFIASLPILVIGLAAFLQYMKSKKSLAFLSLAGGGILVLWNALFMIQYRFGYISMSGPYTIRELTVGKMEMVIEIVNRFLTWSLVSYQ